MSSTYLKRSDFLSFNMSEELEISIISHNELLPQQYNSPYFLLLLIASLYRYPRVGNDCDMSVTCPICCDVSENITTDPQIPNTLGHKFLYI